MSRCGNDRRPGCDAEIDWGILEDGTRVPLTRGAPIYRVLGYDRESNTYAIERADAAAAPGGGYRVNHYKTCPKANNFTKPAPPAPRRSGRDAASGD